MENKATKWTKQGDMRTATINGIPFEVLRNDGQDNGEGRTTWVLLIRGGWDTTHYTMREAMARAEYLAAKGPHIEGCPVATTHPNDDCDCNEVR